MTSDYMIPVLPLSCLSQKPHIFYFSNYSHTTLSSFLHRFLSCFQSRFLADLSKILDTWSNKLRIVFHAYQGNKSTKERLSVSQICPHFIFY